MHFLKQENIYVVFLCVLVKCVDFVVVLKSSAVDGSYAHGRHLCYEVKCNDGVQCGEVYYALALRILCCVEGTLCRVGGCSTSLRKARVVVGI